MTDISREEALAHFGVKGQKWGVRNERRANAAKALVEQKKQKMERGKEARANRPRPFKNTPPTADIKAARKKGSAEVVKLWEKEKKFYDAPKGSDEAKKALVDFKKAESDYLNSETHKLAKTRTKGEKIATVTLAGAGISAAILYAYGMDRIENPR